MNVENSEEDRFVAVSIALDTTAKDPAEWQFLHLANPQYTSPEGVLEIPAEIVSEILDAKLTGEVHVISCKGKWHLRFINIGKDKEEYYKKNWTYKILKSEGGD